MIALAVDLASMGGAGGGAAFSPIQLPSLALWLRADLGVTSAASLVSAWADQSGSGDPNRILAQASDPQKPTLVASDALLANKPSLRFTKSVPSTLLLPPGAWSTTLANPCTIVCALVTTALGGDQFVYDDRTNLFNCGLDMQAAPSATAFTNGGGATLAAAAAAQGTGQVVSVVINGASSTISVSAITPQTSGTLAALSSTGLGVGAAPQSASIGLSGNIAELVAVNAVLSAGNLASLLHYMGTRYGVTIGA